ncbi:oxidoreductase, short chain dehydrogenase/reductase family protein [Necator americanus]|uniref:Oxidoreductase, short chain dehydrogenase/reductase family protein n=1 Tax=Necator americanus TaxID=51031 RepID=W2TVX5_NECAM|nr:oxidoreductase, short chain dehydrogenase/reductase family protein [Necator americanus]ETN85211.1 oxidoreductase, short chain dehydrogenase/reductase family protein [Necator americanus]
MNRVCLSTAAGVASAQSRTVPKFQPLVSKMASALEGQIALVTGASRGIGRGIALQLGQSGATVYITGRKPEKSLQSRYSNLPTLEKTAEEIRQRGGNAVPVYCDHTDHNDIAKLFERINTENGGTLNILVNAAFSGGKDMADSGSIPFFQADPLLWDSINNVGLRNNYICCAHAAKIMTKKKSGLIVNISSAGALQYTFNVPYGVGKAALDRMSADMAVELNPFGVAILSLWPGMVRTEFSGILRNEGKLEKMVQQSKEALDKAFEHSESTEFVGKSVVALASDKKILKKSGKVFMTYDLAREYGFKDENGELPMDIRCVATALEFFGFNRTASIVPSFLRIPLWGMHFASYKFPIKLW